MVKRYGCCQWDDELFLDEDGRWVDYGDYAKLADLCELMATLLKCTPAPIINGNSRYAKEIRAAIAEWEAMK